MRACALLLTAALCAACSPGVGRPPVFPDDTGVVQDAEADAGVPDVLNLDAKPSDAPIVVPDAGPPESFPFTGAFGIIGDNNLLFAREVDNRIMLIVGAFPYVYTGTITDSGAVDASSDTLNRSGCTIATLQGTYDRVNALYQLQHVTCNLSGDPLSSEITGGFGQDYVAGPSGIYELTATLEGNLTCLDVITDPVTVTYGVSILGQDVALFTAHDFEPQPVVYIGRVVGADFAFSTEFRNNANNDVRAEFSGVFSQPNANDPPTLSAQRDVWVPEENCTYRVALDGTRIETP